jgi:hypothetical protein
VAPSAWMTAPAAVATSGSHMTEKWTSHDETVTVA